ncbi:MAG: hypothetical protein Q8O61_10810 [Nocardioides sp.]|nr:hypothetical protein [Nocardioides sp.]
MTRLTPRITHVVVLALAVLVGFSGGAVAKARYDAKNAHKVDGKHAVSAGAPVAKRKGKLVATNAAGRLPNNIIAKAPDAARLGGFTHAQTSTMVIVPQGVGSSGSAVVDANGATLSASSTGGLRLGLVVPPDHAPGTPFEIDVVYREDSPGACSWSVQTSGLEGPDSDTGPDIHNGGWQFPGSGTGYSGLVSVPAGAGSVHTLTLAWPFLDNPGMFIQLALARDGGDVADTCSTVSVYGMLLRY